MRICTKCEKKLKFKNKTGYCKECIRKYNLFKEIAHKQSSETRKKLSEALKGKSTGKAKTVEAELLRRSRISATMKKNPNAGGLREGSGRGKKQWYESKIAGKVYLRSTWELEYVKYLDKNNINWKQNLIKFPYEWQNKVHYYIPDFYLIDTNEFIEVKGYKRDQDNFKWKNFPYKLSILMYDELKNLGLEIKK